MKVALVGLGLIGGSIGLEIKANRFAQKIIGVDQNPSHCKLAIDLGIVNEIWSLEEAATNCDLIILSIPVDSIAKTLPQILSLAKKNATITDMGSTKVAITQSVLNHPQRHLYVPAHPMAGTEHSGPKAAFRGLFVGRTAVICDRELSDSNSLNLVESLFHSLKMRLVYMASHEHDVHTAYVSHLSHITSFVLANTVLDLEKNDRNIFDLAGGGFESTVRLAKSSPQMWEPIFEQNKTNIVAALDSYLDHMKYFRDSLVQKSSTKTIQLMDQANQIKHVLERIQKPSK